MHRWPLYWMALIARSFLFLTYFNGLHFLLAILSIFSLKKLCFVFLTVPLNFFQFSNCFDCLYLSRSFQQLSSYQALECFVILTFLECLCYMLLIFVAREFTISLSTLQLRIESVLRFLMKFINSLIKQSSSLLFLARTHFIVWIYSLSIDILTEMGAWSETSLQSGWIW